MAYDKPTAADRQVRSRRQLRRNEAALAVTSAQAAGLVSCADRLAPAFGETLAARMQAKASGLGVAAGGGGQEKDGIEAIHRAIARYFVAQPERVQASFNAVVDAHRVHANGAVDGSIGVTDGDAPAVTAVPLTGVFSCNGKHFLVDGQRLYALDALCFHGVVSPLDVGWFHGIGATLAVVLRHAREHAALDAQHDQA